MGGLAADVYEFRGQAPSLERIERRVRELTDMELTIEGTLGPSPTDRPEVKLPAGCRNIPLRSTNVTFRESKSRRNIKLHVSLDGKRMVMAGNHNQLFKVIAEALAELGGIVDEL